MRMETHYGKADVSTYRTWDLGQGSSESEPGSVPKVFTDPRPPYGRIGLVLHRDG